MQVRNDSHVERLSSAVVCDTESPENSDGVITWTEALLYSRGGGFQGGVMLLTSHDYLLTHAPLLFVRRLVI